jgi:hypothetical protein
MVGSACLTNVLCLRETVVICDFFRMRSRTTCRLFFPIFLFEEMFADIDNVFPFPLQSNFIDQIAFVGSKSLFVFVGAPLDLGTTVFYDARKTIIKRRLNQISKYNSIEMAAVVSKRWSMIEGVPIQSLRGT